MPCLFCHSSYLTSLRLSSDTHPTPSSASASAPCTNNANNCLPAQAGRTASLRVVQVGNGLQRRDCNQLFEAAWMAHRACSGRVLRRSTRAAPRGSLHEGRSTGVAPRGPLHGGRSTGGVADLFHTDLRSILMILWHFKGTSTARVGGNNCNIRSVSL